TVGPTAPPGGATPPVPTSASRRLLDDVSTGSFYVRYFTPFPAVDPALWTLTVDGLVSAPRSFSLAEIQALPLVSQISRLKCVECWSAAAKWGGFRYDSLAAIVRPAPEARWVHFRCADGYYESLSIEELRLDRVLFVHRMNDQPLPDDHGAPLRMIVPFKYGYKGAKAITHLSFENGQLRGYWPAVGGYNVNGNVQEGWDHPLDLPGTRRIDGDETRYPDGTEANG
ncbi:MAG TPA: molybdopterin-dependent oxidoreductase, partial [Chloroflexota bacterium]